MGKKFKITSVIVDENFKTVFSEEDYSKNTHGAMELSDRIDALNFRLRESDAGYSSDWHVAGDPTLILIQRGIVRIILRDTSFKDFKSGELFIVKDYLPDTIPFDTTIHGHRAEVIGDEKFCAVHIKLSSLKNND
jgi:hypothetical protein